MAELRARGSVLWLVFAPLARDATVAAMRSVVEAIRAGARDREEQIDLFAALLVMAKIDPWKHNLEQEIQAMLSLMPTDDERRLFTRRVGRRPSADEERALVDRARELGAEQVEDALLDREGEGLVRWLLGSAKPNGKKPKPTAKRAR